MTPDLRAQYSRNVGRRRLTFQLLDALQGSSAECGRIASNGLFASPLHPRHSAIECGNQVAKLTKELCRRHRHRRAPYRLFCARDTFHTSPHSVQRQ